MPQLDAFAESEICSLPSEIVTALTAAPLAGLGDSPQVAELAQVLAGQSTLDWGPVPAGQRKICLSGLWLAAGELDRSHTISQDIGSADGSFWHGIMHRREGDFGNSKYWFRRVGSHPVLDRMDELTGGVYADPFDFVDRCQSAIRTGGDDQQACENAQWIEWQALMAHCLST